MILNMHDIYIYIKLCDMFACVYIHMGGTSVYNLIQRTFVESAQTFDCGEISGWVPLEPST